MSLFFTAASGMSICDIPDTAVFFQLQSSVILDECRSKSAANVDVLTA